MTTPRDLPIISLADFGASGYSGIQNQTITLSNNAQTIHASILDADNAMEDHKTAWGARDPDGAQPLEAPIAVGGVTYNAGTDLWNLGEATITNTTTGETGELLMIGLSNDISTILGVSSTITMIPGQSYTVTAVDWTVNDTQWADLKPVVCFTRGTLIKTDQGERLIEDLAAGDMVLTTDNGYQPIRWIGSSKRAATGDLAPILIRKGALGNDRDLRVSPQHRMLLQGWQAGLLFGAHEVLATAKSLLNDHSIVRDEGGEVEYFHILFDTHEIIYAEGCRSESFHPAKQGWKALDQATRDEILAIFPQHADGNFNDYGSAARMSLKHKEGNLLGAYMAGSV